MIKFQKKKMIIIAMNINNNTFYKTFKKKNIVLFSGEILTFLKLNKLIKKNYKRMSSGEVVEKLDNSLGIPRAIFLVSFFFVCYCCFYYF